MRKPLFKTPMTHTNTNPNVKKEKESGVARINAIQGKKNKSAGRAMLLTKAIAKNAKMENKVAKISRLDPIMCAEHRTSTNTIPIERRI